MSIAVQERFAFARPSAARVRSCRRPFRPSRGEGGYRLPHDIAARLVAALAPFRNRDAAFTLAVFLARFWSVPGRVSGAFPIDRRALAEHCGLDLTEARVRGAIKALEAVGFLARAFTTGSTYKPTEHGLRKKPIKFVFGSAYAPAFIAANSRAAAVRGRKQGERRPITQESRQMASAVNYSGTKSPKSTNPSERSVLMGEVRKECGFRAKAFEPNTALEAALARLKEAIGLAEG